MVIEAELLHAACRERRARGSWMELRGGCMHNELHSQKKAEGKWWRVIAQRGCFLQISVFVLQTCTVHLQVPGAAEFLTYRQYFGWVFFWLVFLHRRFVCLFVWQDDSKKHTADFNQTCCRCVAMAKEESTETWGRLIHYLCKYSFFYLNFNGASRSKFRSSWCLII